jgi:hypothetical protein
MADAVASAYNNGQISPYQLKWLISGCGTVPGALTPVSDAFARTENVALLDNLSHYGIPRI